MVSPPHYRTERATLGRTIVFAAWGVATLVLALVFSLLLILVGQAGDSVTLNHATSILGKAQSAGNGKPFPRSATQPQMLVARPFGSRCASATLCCVSCQGRGHCRRNAP